LALTRRAPSEARQEVPDQLPHSPVFFDLRAAARRGRVIYARGGACKNGAPGDLSLGVGRPRLGLRPGRRVVCGNSSSAAVNRSLVAANADLRRSWLPFFSAPRRKYGSRRQPWRTTIPHRDWDSAVSRSRGSAVTGNCPSSVPCPYGRLRRYAGGLSFACARLRLPGLGVLSLRRMAGLALRRLTGGPERQTCAG
jgi:hypothetical protein